MLLQLIFQAKIKICASAAQLLTFGWQLQCPNRKVEASATDRQPRPIQHLLEDQGTQAGTLEKRGGR